MKSTMTRRSFLKKSSLVIAVATVAGESVLFSVNADELPADFRPNAFVEIDREGLVTVWVGQTNLGQGSHTGLSMIVAEELDADWSRVRVRMALAADEFKSLFWRVQVTGGSSSIRHRWDQYRKAGAAARAMLVAAAARRWGCDAARCMAVAGEISHEDGRKLTYGELVPDAATEKIPPDPSLKDPTNYRIIGSPCERLDIPDKIAGRAVYGMDVRVPGMVFAVVARPPRYGATPVAHDAGAALAVQGVSDVVPLEGRIAVCADSTWAAMQGREKLAIRWSEGSHPDLSDDSLDELFAADLARPGAVGEAKGDAEKALAEAAKTVTATYSFPFVAHAPLEPLNATAHVEKDRCRVWVPTQGQTPAQEVAAQISGLSLEKIEVHTPMTGGGFGLRGEIDPVIDAVSLAKQLDRPVQVVWTREDDFANDYFRPASVQRIRGGVDSDGRPIAWAHKIASPSISSRKMPRAVRGGVDGSSIQGVPDMPYTLANRSVEYVLSETGVPVGYWRSVGYSFNAFAVETFVDELAGAAGRDPVEFRLSLMEADSRPHRTLSLLAEKSGWGGPVPEGRGRGVAVTSCFGSSAAHMAEVSVDRATGRITAHKVVCAVDCGPAVYPDAIVAQMEGAVVMALSMAFHEKVRFAGGGVSSLNFDSYPLLTMSEVPEIEVHISDSRHEIGGIGEPGLPSVAPAVANAVFRVAGVRLRRLPFEPGELRRS